MINTTENCSTKLSSQVTPFSINDILLTSSNGSTSVQRLNTTSTNNNQSDYQFSIKFPPSSAEMMFYRGTGPFDYECEKKDSAHRMMRRGSLECFLIDNKEAAEHRDRINSYFGEENQKKPLDMRRHANGLSDAYDSGKGITKEIGLFGWLDMIDDTTISVFDELGRA